MNNIAKKTKKAMYVYEMEWCIIAETNYLCARLSIIVTFKYLRNSGHHIWGIWALIEDDPSQWYIHTNIRIKLIKIFYSIAL